MTVSACGMLRMSVLVLVAVVVDLAPYSPRWPVTTIVCSALSATAAALAAAVVTAASVESPASAAIAGDEAPARSAAANDAVSPCVMRGELSLLIVIRNSTDRRQR